MTVTAALKAYIIADTTLAAKVGSAVYPATSPQNPPDNFAVTKIISSPSEATLLGATDQVSMRVEVTFWSKLNEDAEKLANRFRTIVSKFNGVMGGTGGVTVAVSRTHGPRGLYNPETRFYGSQVDIMATVDLSTAS
jgi:hypothetical protein